MSNKQRREIPTFSTPLIETHCHLDYLPAEKLEAILSRSRSVGVERFVTIAVSTGNLSTVLTLTRQAPDIWGTQGIHPHEAESFDHQIGEQIRRGAADERIVAIGEIGLDYYYDNADRAVQRRVFDAQLQIAADMSLPVVIHTREADDDTRDILQNHSAKLSRKGVIHSFTSSLSLAEFCLSEGFYLGFNGITTFKTANNVREVVAATPRNQLLLETDAPYLTPVPYRGKPNAPYYLPFVAEQIATTQQSPIEDVLAQVRANSLALFFGSS